MSNLVEVEGVSRYFGDHRAVRDLSFVLDEAGAVGLLGPNGAGKSTTLNLLSGNLAPNSGRIVINGVDLRRQPRKAKAFLGYLPDTPPVYPESTVDEYLSFCAKIHRIARAKRARSIAEAKQRCGLDEVGKRLIGALSKGFRQRLGIAQAILHAPPLIILDEPMVGLDPIQLREMRDLIGKMAQQHAILLSSHLLPEVQNSCTRSLIIDRGRLILDTDIDDLDQHLSHSSLILKTRAAADLSILRRINGVDTVELIGENSYRIAFRKDSDPTEQIAEKVVGSGCGLLELCREQRSVEEVFLHMTAPAEARENGVVP